MKKQKKKSKSNQDEIEESYQILIDKFDKIFEKDFGKMCPDFEPACVQCTAHLIYNTFKKRLYDELVKAKI